MPWLSIAVWLVSFLISKSSGASTTKAALIATGAGLASYYMIDPANKDNVMGLKLGTDATASTDPKIAGSPGSITGTVTTPQPSLGSTVVSEAGKVLTSWGPTGTAGVIATTGVATGAINPEKYWPWLVGLGALFILTR